MEFYGNVRVITWVKNNFEKLEPLGVYYYNVY